MSVCVCSCMYSSLQIKNKFSMNPLLIQMGKYCFALDLCSDFILLYYVSKVRKNKYSPPNRLFGDWFLYISNSSSRHDK